MTASNNERIEFLFLVTHVASECETEGDYDTADDLVTSDITSISVSLETPYGLEIHLEQTTISSSHSYIEPDFDHLEKSGEVTYRTHPDNENDSTTVHGHDSYSLPVEIPVISRDEYAELVETLAAGIQLPDHLDNYRFYEMDHPDHFREPEGSIGLPDDVIDTITNICGSNTRRRVSRPIKVSLPVSVVERIKAAEARLRTRRLENFNARLHNKVQIALYDLLGKTQSAPASVSR